MSSSLHTLWIDVFVYIYLYKRYFNCDDDADGIIYILVWFVCVSVCKRYKCDTAGNSIHSSTHAPYMLWTGDFPLFFSSYKWNINSNNIQFSQRRIMQCESERSSKRVFCMRIKYFIINWNEGGGVSGWLLVQFLFVADLVLPCYFGHASVRIVFQCWCQRSNE